jgi:hypothetical protein
MASEARFRGFPVSQTSTDRRHRPSISAALSPAGPPPTITTSYMPAVACMAPASRSKDVPIGPSDLRIFGSPRQAGAVKHGCSVRVKELGRDQGLEARLPGQAAQVVVAAGAGGGQARVGAGDALERSSARSVSPRSAYMQAM